MVREPHKKSVATVDAARRRGQPVFEVRVAVEKIFAALLASKRKIGPPSMRSWFRWCLYFPPSIILAAITHHFIGAGFVESMFAFFMMQLAMEFLFGKELPT